jgi:formate/nitrite transporter FocA (FNT family)
MTGRGGGRQGVALGAPGVTWGSVVLKNILPVTLGNAFAGAILVACSYSLAYGALGRRLSGGK